MMQYVMQARRAPTAGYGMPVVGYFPAPGPGVMDTRRYTGHTLPGGIGALGCGAGITTSQNQLRGLAALGADSSGWGAPSDAEPDWVLGSAPPEPLFDADSFGDAVAEVIDEAPDQDLANQAGQDPAWLKAVRDLVGASADGAKTIMEGLAAQEKAKGRSDDEVRKLMELASSASARVGGVPTGTIALVGVLAVGAALAWALLGRKR